MTRRVLVALALLGPIALAASPALAGPPSGGDTVATFRGGVVTADDMTSVAAKELMKARRDLYRAEEQAARKAAYRKILAEKAKAAGMTPEEWEEKEIAPFLTPPDPKRVDEILERYRSKLPKDVKEARKIVEDALTKDQRKRARKALQDRLLEEAGFQLLIEPPRAVVRIDPDDPVEGPQDAPVTIVEFSDFQCPYCARAANTVAELLGEYGDLIRVVHKPFPLASHHWSRKAVEAALCANEQGRYREYHDWLFDHRTTLSDDAFLKAAKELGLDTEAFSECYRNQPYEQKIQDSITQGRILGVTATPSFFIDGRFLEGAVPIERFRTLIDEELRRKGIAPPPHPTPTPVPTPAKPKRAVKPAAAAKATPAAKPVAARPGTEPRPVPGTK